MSIPCTLHVLFTYSSEGKVEESIKYLEMFVEISEKANDERAVSRASSCLGTTFNSLVSMSEAQSFFQFSVKPYLISIINNNKFHI